MTALLNKFYALQGMKIVSPTRYYGVLALAVAVNVVLCCPGARAAVSKFIEEA